MTQDTHTVLAETIERMRAEFLKSKFELDELVTNVEEKRKELEDSK